MAQRRHIADLQGPLQRRTLGSRSKQIVHSYSRRYSLSLMYFLALFGAFIILSLIGSDEGIKEPICSIEGVFIFKSNSKM